MPELRSSQPLVWIDCEMTGLDPDSDTILSIACFITDAQLNLLDPAGLELTIHHSSAALDRMNDWCKRTHHASGLTAAVLASTTTPDAAATALLTYVQKYVPQVGTALLAGNSVHADRSFLRRAPYDCVLAYLHYRILDVSSLKEAARRWAPDHVLQASPRKQGLHEAKADVLESIEEVRYWKQIMFGG